MGAILSTCGRYRYGLDRSLSMGDRIVAFIGVNPSTADADVDDATVRKWRGFSARWGFDKFFVGNLFAWRSTDVRALATAGDPVGPENDAHLRVMLSYAELVVPCWGDSGKLPAHLRMRIEAVRELICESERPAKCLGLTKGGDPKHPLMLGYSTQLQDWRA
jgi:hypothetical protein